MKKGLKGLLWLLMLVLLVGVAQHMPPWKWVDDPDAVPEEVPGLFGLGGGTSPARGSAAQAAADSACHRCRGEGQIDCPTCRGSGQTETIRRTQCLQCRGTGVYRSRVSSRSGSPCAFCRGTGQEEQRQMTNCSRCGGHRRISCPACQNIDQP